MTFAAPTIDAASMLRACCSATTGSSEEWRPSAALQSEIPADLSEPRAGEEGCLEHNVVQKMTRLRGRALNQAPLAHEEWSW